ncbi:MAG: histidine phosphatase family protein [Cyanobacteria bacterium P01_C01_bin.73]
MPSTSPLRVQLIRHGQSEGNAVGRMEGQQSSGLSRLGRQQTNALAIALGDSSPTHLYCSPSRRALETLQVVLDHLQGKATPTLDALESVLGSPPTQISATFRSAADLQTASIPLVITPDLQEAHGGILQNLTWAEARDRYPDLCHQLETTPDWLPVPGAETPEQLRQRSQRFWRQLLATHHNGDRLWIVSHSGFLQHLISEIMGCDRTWSLSMPHTARFEVSVDRDRWQHRNVESIYNRELWKIHRFNDSSHLPAPS